MAGPRARSWTASTIHGQRRRGNGILNNELYIGRIVWNRLRFIKEPETGKTRVRLVDINSEVFRVARAYMIRLEAEDFAHAAWVDRLAQAAHLTPGVFRQRFEYLGSAKP